MAERPVPAVRYADVCFGDDLRAVALRELGDAAYWPVLAQLNGLQPPYVAETASSGVLSYGSRIKLPAPSSLVPADIDPTDLFGIDIAAGKRLLEVENGDFALAAGIPNLSAALSRRVIVGKRELAFHPTYGCHVRSLLGDRAGPTTAALAAFFVRSSLLEDERVDSVTDCTAEVVGDQISVVAVVVPITGKPVEMRILL